MKIRALKPNYTRMGREIPQTWIDIDPVKYWGLDEKKALAGDIIIAPRSMEQVVQILNNDKNIEIQADSKAVKK